MFCCKSAAALLLGLGTSVMAQTSLWVESSVPATKEVTNDTRSVSLGLSFQAKVPGSVTAIRFYKGLRNTGTHIGTLWSSSGAKLSSVIFTNETASGWQQANFSSAVPIAANTTYVISYLAPRGYYALDQRYAWSGLNNASLRISGSAPGTFSYGVDPKLPTETWKTSNYCVDVVFVPAATPTTFSILGKVSGSAAAVTLS